jgi:hypothetical protein
MISDLCYGLSQYEFPPRYQAIWSVLVVVYVKEVDWQREPNENIQTVAIGFIKESGVCALLAILWPLREAMPKLCVDT